MKRILFKLNFYLYLCLLPFTAYATPCGLHGDATTAKASQLNVLKNRRSTPTKINASISLADILAPGNDLKRFSQTDAATIAGVVVKVKLGGSESCNCHQTDPLHVDRHIYVGTSAMSALKDCIICEVTPRFYAAHPDWVDLNHLVGHLVKFTGWILVDTEHTMNAVNTNPKNKKDWRKTVNELHPVTGIEVLK
jgi:hypothetical protein